MLNVVIGDNIIYLYLIFDSKYIHIYLKILQVYIYFDFRLNSLDSWINNFLLLR